MGYAHYEIHRNGETIQAGYAVEAVCEKDGCNEKIDRGLGYLCGKTPGGDEHGCGGYYCDPHLTYDNQCQRCADAADKANRWVHPDTGEEFDLRDQFLPAGATYDGCGTVWKHLGDFDGDTPLLTPVSASSERPTGEAASPIAEGEWQDAAEFIGRRKVDA
ncbi:hypothetical protein [Streptomyces sp. C3-3]|uniref:hypothetical protein n=1 Tax=Streptomyces sp. C3-3 TaxID=2824901 RepID=UPI001B35DF26|nr:hypothetical protein [Streptomyces sp. C3-3]MBQ1118456.1 hypothetical protein [Streptomyces sp. C3-3]